jgi:hypothetical protein
MRNQKSVAWAMSATSVIAKMRKLFVILPAFMLSLVAASSPAETTINGPVGITVDGDVYATYYSTTEYYRILENYTATVGPSITAPTNNPNGLVGIEDATPTFSQPWWVGASDPTGAKAQAAAIEWYNTSGFPVNDGVQTPNVTQTPYFVYATGDTSDQVFYAYAYFDAGSSQVVSSIAQSDINADNFSYALAGPVVPVPEPSTITIAGIGIGLAGWSAWKKRRVAKGLVKK